MEEEIAGEFCGPSHGQYPETCFPSTLTTLLSSTQSLCLPRMCQKDSSLALFYPKQLGREGNVNIPHMWRKQFFHQIHPRNRKTDNQHLLRAKSTLSTAQSPYTLSQWTPCAYNHTGGSRVFHKSYNKRSITISNISQLWCNCAVWSHTHLVTAVHTCHFYWVLCVVISHLEKRCYSICLSKD